MTFYFYDLETSGFNRRDDRIMQFAGQRTDMDLNPIGKMDATLVKMAPDVLPEPGAVLIHGITPQQTVADGITEAEFCKYLTNQVSRPDTIIVGFNSIRFDNDFIRFTLWRNFYDAYEWSWKDNCSVWDLLDVVRMTRALRPDGIKWPFAPDGKPTNSLEYLTAVNKLDHTDAHDATSDVTASIALARLLKQKQPKLFNYLLNIRSKHKIRPFVTKSDPVVYTSGRYSSEFNKTTVVVLVAERADKSGALMYDLRIDPDEFKDLSVAELAERWAARGEDVPYFPVKVLGYNRCPAVAPLEVLEKDGGYEKIKLHKAMVADHLEKLQKACLPAGRTKGFGDKLLDALEQLWPKRQAGLVTDPQKVDGTLYDGFVPNEDKARMSMVRAASEDELSGLSVDFKDERLQLLLPLYKARNYPKSLSLQEKKEWESFRRQKLLAGGDSSLANHFYMQLEEFAKTPGLSTKKQSLLKDLKQYADSIRPAV